MDRLAPFFEKFSLTARMFYSGFLCGSTGDQVSEHAGHLHVLRKGRLKITRPDARQMVIDTPSIPTSATAASLLSRGAVGIETLIAGGDDYEVLCTIPEAKAGLFTDAARQAGVVVTAIGTIMAGEGLPRFLDAEGRELALRRLSHSHF